MGGLGEALILMYQSYVFNLPLQRHHLALSRRFLQTCRIHLLRSLTMISYIVVLGDFNARVGVLDEDGSLW